MKRLILAIVGVIAAVAPVLAQAQKESIAQLIQQGNRKQALERIRAGGDVNELEADGTSAVHWAIYRVDHELLQALIAKKAKLDVANQFGSTPLSEAVEQDDAAAMKMLLDAGANPEGANADGETALMLAAKAGNLAMVQNLLNAGAKVNVVEKYHDQTPLMWAAAGGEASAAEIVKLLLAKGADVKARALYNDWPSQISSEPRAQYRPVGGLTALLYASRDGCYLCVDELIAAGADVNVPTPEGVTPLMIAIDNGHNDLAKLLLDKGAKPGVWDWWGRTALYIAVDRKDAGGGGGRGGGAGAGVGAGRGAGSRGGGSTVSTTPVSNMGLITMLLDKGVDVNQALNMHRPSRGGNSGRFGDNQLSTGCTPLFRAMQSNDTPVIQALLDHGANPNIMAMGYSPFLLAAGVAPGGRGGGGGGAGSMQMLDLLIQHGADVNTRVTGTKSYTMRVPRSPSTNEGESALHNAAQAGRLDVVKFLLEHGADANLLDGNGKKPIDLVGAPRGAAGATGSGAADPAAGAGKAKASAPPAGAGAAKGKGGAPVAGGRGGPGGGRGGANSAGEAEIKSLLEAAMQKPSGNH